MAKPKQRLVEVEYSSNNSGGHWWLKDKDWTALEKSGWWVEWGGLYFCHSTLSSLGGGKKPNRLKPCISLQECNGHRIFESHVEMTKDDRWLGCLAKVAKKKFPDLAAAIREWEKITGKSAADEGCNCCGPPHSFSFRDGDKYEYASGDDVLRYLYQDVPSSMREAVERLNRRK